MATSIAPANLTLFQEIGPWVQTRETRGAYANSLVYFDQSGNEYLVGTGPGFQADPIITGAGDSMITGTDQANLVNTTLNPAVNLGTSIESTAANSVPLTQSISGQISSIFGSSPIGGWLTGSLIGGIPNWLLLVGVAGFFYISNEGKNK